MLSLEIIVNKESKSPLWSCQVVIDAQVNGIGAKKWHKFDKNNNTTSLCFQLPQETLFVSTFPTSRGKKTLFRDCKMARKWLSRECLCR